MILVSVTVILPLALMKQLGKWGTEGLGGAQGAGGSPVPTAAPLSPPRLPRLRQRLLPQLHGFLPHLGEHGTEPHRPLFRLVLFTQARAADTVPPHPLLLPQPSQVIYKKFQIPCPLPDQGGNGTAGLNYTAASSGGHWDDSMGPQPPELGACTPSFFTLNSQVGFWGLRRGGSQPRGELPVPCAQPPTPSQTAYTIPIMAFAFVCHPEVLPIYTELKE